MRRRHRLSRSRDFDAVYRHGRSVASRYLVLYAFRRPDDDGAAAEPATARVGLAVPRQVGDAADRNRVKRRLRAAMDEIQDRLDGSTDYILIARPGLAEAAEAQGFAWLLGEVGDVVRRSGPAAGVGA
jgi:ribonuclease P protein component